MVRPLPLSRVLRKGEESDRASRNLVRRRTVEREELPVLERPLVRCPYRPRRTSPVPRKRDPANVSGERWASEIERSSAPTVSRGFPEWLRRCECDAASNRSRHSFVLDTLLEGVACWNSRETGPFSTRFTTETCSRRCDCRARLHTCDAIRTALDFLRHHALRCGRIGALDVQ
jgi:hypothetical protein